SGGEIAVNVTTPRAGEALVAVRDSGIGVAAEDRERIFDYLYRAPRSEERNLSGLGLGLYVSRHLVERMGGRLWLESTSTEPPSGSEFRFTLPITE
ncbi:MAG TPA: ATP-binding protein, partial [Ktedonobacterales bacterium]|nr:ATP-binding protein [Ktedonobacterales bacterium]